MGKIACTRAAFGAGSPYQADLTVSGFGTVKAWILYFSNCLADDTEAADAIYCLSLDGQYVAGASDDAVATTQTYRKSDTNAAWFMDGEGNTIFAVSDVKVTNITDGIRVEASSGNPGQRLVTAILFGGDLQVYSSRVAMGAEDVEITEDTVGFEPDFIFGQFQIGDANETPYVSFGMAHNGVSITQSAMFSRFLDNDPMGSGSDHMIGEFVNDRIAGGPSGFPEFEITEFNSAGFKVTARENTGASRHLKYLAVKMNQEDSKLQIYTTPGSTGNEAKTGFGFTPQVVIAFTSWHTDLNSEETNTKAGHFGLSVFDENDEYSNMSYEASEFHIGSPTRAKSMSKQTAIYIIDPKDGSQDGEASFVSMDADGYTLNWSSVPSPPRYYMALAIEEDLQPPATPVGSGIMLLGLDEWLT